MTHHGVARAHGAVTVVNAIPAGRGAAFGVELATEAEVSLATGFGPVEVTIEEEPAADPSLAEACLQIVADHLDTPLSGQITTRSEIPIARGLKSSSTAANAIVLAMLDALDEAPPPATVLELSVAAARRAGVTVTGALDDTAASLLGGLVVTDNRQDEVVERKPIQTTPVVLLLVPPTRRETSSVGDRLTAMAPLAERLIDDTLDGRWDKALTLNGLAVATCLDEPLDPAYRALAAGALAAGMTGTGPAVAAVCDRDDAPAIREAWDRYDAEILATHPTDEGLPWEGAA